MVPNSQVAAREMSGADVPAVAALLAEGFARWRDRAFWDQALQRLGARGVPDGAPRYGYVLTSGERVVGVLLVIAADAAEPEGTVRRLNASSWYIEPAFRLYGTLLVGRLFRQRDAVVSNVTPAPETWTLLAAQGYRPYVQGRAFALPALSRRAGRGRAAAVDGALRAGAGLSDTEAGLLRDHLAWGCLGVVVETPSGRVPFMFGPRRRRGVPFAYLLYCRSLDSFAEHARALGWFLLRRGITMVVADADARLGGMPSLYQPNRPKFFRGAIPPRPGDLAYTERAVFGV